MSDLFDRQVTRRDVMRGGAAVTLGGLIAACAPFGGTTSSPPTKDELKLSFTSLGTQALDPLLGPDNNLPYLDLLYDPVVGNSYKATDLSKASGLAKSWTVSPDSRSFTFQLRSWKFHNGDDVTADDVAFSLQRFGGPRDVTPQGKTLAANLDSVTATGPLEVQVKLKNPTPAFLLGTYNEMTDVTSLVIPKNYFEKVGQDAFAQNPIGSGPYKIAQRQVGALVQLESAYAEHYGVGKPRFKTVTMRIVTDENTRIAQLKSGDADFIDVAATSVPALTKLGYHAFPRKAPDTLAVFYQTQKPGEPTADINLRKALAYAINRDEINKAFLAGLGVQTGEWMAAQIGLQKVSAIPFDIAMAKAALAKTPYGPGGQTLTIQLQVPNRDGWPQLVAIAQAVQGYWKAIGIETKIINSDYASFRAQLANHTLPSPAAVVFNFPGTVAWLPNSRVFTSCNGVLTTMCDSQMESLLGDWAQQSTLQGYTDAAAKAQKYILDNFYIAPILEAPGYYVGSSYVRSDYSPGVSFLGINTRALVTSKFDY